MEQSEGKGRGVFSVKKFKRGEPICEYSGELITYKEAIKREEVYSKDQSIGCYMYYFKDKDEKLWYGLYVTCVHSNTTIINIQ